MFIGTQKIVKETPLENGLVKVEFKDDPNYDVYHPEVLEAVKTGKKNTDLRQVKVDRGIVFAEKILEVMTEYNIRYDDVREIFQRVNDSFLSHLARCDVKQMGFECSPSQDPRMLLDRKTIWHVRNVIGE